MVAAAAAGIFDLSLCISFSLLFCFFGACGAAVVVAAFLLFYIFLVVGVAWRLTLWFSPHGFFLLQIVLRERLCATFFAKTLCFS